ncbi:Presenilin-like protein [Seminavis robusta]|uniref:Presenilin n=1 Tax=Seminavis robusta TaxID=568900 RepID=A0A9N8ETS5_9STRA|nr:Presenilin-like protein [Seminavis robusta]|eukprot:Sro1797_g298210.1 Presenilin-like protein (555) ;mRNA; f:16530-18401
MTRSRYSDHDREEEEDPGYARSEGIFRNTHQEADGGSADDSGVQEEGKALSVSELLYSSSSYYAIAKPVSMTMMLSALSVVYINNEETIENGEAAMANAYQVFSTDGSGGLDTLLLSFANSIVMVSVICMMTFVIVLLYKFKCMKCLIGYMIFCSATLLGVLGGNLFQTALYVYHIPMDIISYYFFIYNFCVVGVASVFWGQGIPKYITQAYLIATAVILAWHLSYFDSWTTWSLLTMLALYDLCAVLTPCGPLRFLVDLMSKDDAPEMPGLLYEAELPPEARRPGMPRGAKGSKNTNYGGKQYGSRNSRGSDDDEIMASRDDGSGNSGVMDNRSEDGSGEEGPLIDIPLAIASVYNLPVLVIPHHSLATMSQGSGGSDGPSNSPLLASNGANPMVPENPTPAQLRAEVTVRLPKDGGRINRVAKRGKKVYLETDRQGKPKRILWVDRTGKVFAEMRGDDEDMDEQNSIRLGLGDFIFYSVLVAKAAQYSFATFAACILVILAGLGGTLVLLSVYHHALPALPISIFLGVVFYVFTRVFMEPWIAQVLQKPYYV